MTSYTQIDKVLEKVEGLAMDWSASSSSLMGKMYDCEHTFFIAIYLFDVLITYEKTESIIKIFAASYTKRWARF